MLSQEKKSKKIRAHRTASKGNATHDKMNAAVLAHLGDLPSDDESYDESDNDSGNVNRKPSTSIWDDDDSEDDDSIVEEELDMETFCFCHVTNDNEHAQDDEQAYDDAYDDDDNNHDY